MEFLPSDITPLHQPGDAPCDLVVCLDPRRSAEDTCPDALGNYVDASSSTPRQWRNLWQDIELGLHDPNTKFPDITERLETMRSGHQRGAQWFQSHMLNATGRLLEHRAARVPVPSGVSYRSYRNIAAISAEVAHQYDSDDSYGNRATAIGRMAELVLHGALLRSRRVTPLLTSPREEASQHTRLNHDIAILSAEGTSRKIPVQVKTASENTGPQDRILHIAVEELLKAPELEFESLRWRYRRCPSRTRVVTNIIAAESQKDHAAKSAEARLLRTLGKLLADHIGGYHETFLAEAHAEGVQNLVNDALPNMPQAKAKASLRESEVIQLGNGRYIFFNQLAVARGYSPEGHPEHRLTVGLRDHAIAVVGARTVHNTTKLFQDTAEPYSEDFGQLVLHQLAQSKQSPQWQPVA